MIDLRKKENPQKDLQLKILHRTKTIMFTAKKINSNQVSITLVGLEKNSCPDITENSITFLCEGIGQPLNLMLPKPLTGYECWG